MKVSKILDNVQATPTEVQTIGDLAAFATKNNYSLGTFRKNHRRIENFECAEALALDFDSGPDIDTMKVRCAEYKHVIMPTRNHRKPKNGVVCDRYRVILFLSAPITDAETFGATYMSLLTAFPEADTSCKDPARQFYASTGVESVNESGKLVDPVKPAPRPKLEVVQPVDGARGELSKATLKLLLEGAPAGHRHQALIKAAIDAKEQGYTKDEFTAKLADMIKRTGNWSTPDVNAEDRKQIDKIFDKHEVKYPPRTEGIKRAFNFVPIGDLLKQKLNLEWVADRLFPKGGVSIVAGPPKSGKSTLVRQLAVAVLRGDNFLDRKTSQGDVLYLALEEQLEVLQDDFRTLGVLENDRLQIHVGLPMTADGVNELHVLLNEMRPTLCVIDTLFKFSQVKSDKDYMEVQNAMAKITAMARSSGTHICVLHHTSKTVEGERNAGARKILGSQAIHGAVDVAVIIEQERDTRYISTSPRVGRKINYRMLVYDENKRTLTLGPETEEF